jgi:hypothetical protein
VWERNNKGNKNKQLFLVTFPTIPQTSSEGKIGASKPEG